MIFKDGSELENPSSSRIKTKNRHHPVMLTDVELALIQQKSSVISTTNTLRKLEIDGYVLNALGYS